MRAGEHANRRAFLDSNVSVACGYTDRPRLPQYNTLGKNSEINFVTIDVT